MTKFTYETIRLCPYCGKEVPEEWDACCGEANHSEQHYVSEDAQGDQVFVCPKTNKTFEEPCEESRL